MFQSFTGSPRRPRQVNLSGRHTNTLAPFTPGKLGPHGHGPQNSLAVAQQERILRQQERDRLGAVRVLQRTWRGYRSREITRRLWRAEWDTMEERRTGDPLAFDSNARLEIVETSPPVRYATVGDCLSQLRLLLHFLEIRHKGDGLRLDFFSKAFQTTLEGAPTTAIQGEWTTLLLRLAKTTLRVLQALAASSPAPSISVDHLLGLIKFLIGLIPKQIAQIAQQYYSIMMTLTRNIERLSEGANLSRNSLIDSVLALLRPITSETLGAYEWFAKIYLTIPDLESYLGTITDLAANINYKLLASALDMHFCQVVGFGSLAEDMDARLWLIAYFIFFRRYVLGDTTSQQAPDPVFVKVVSGLLGSMVTHVARGLEAEDVAENGQSPSPLPPFVRDQVLSLLNQSSITGLLLQVRSSNFSHKEELATFDLKASNEAKILATYALTLLRVFPGHGDEIRMWLYLSSASPGGEAQNQQVSQIPATRFFWQASRNTNVFAIISQDSNQVLSVLKPILAGDSKCIDYPDTSSHDREQEWTIILLFLELYTFLLRATDDEEFFSGGMFSETPSTRLSWTKESALPLRDVKDMTIFLKNLAFTLYWNAADLNSADSSHDIGGIRSYFNQSAFPEPIITIKDSEIKNRDKGLSGVAGIPLDYFKGLVTGVLRMIHERDSRRKFLPEGHWLMTGRLDMEGFISTVVAEEESRHQLQAEEDDTENQDSFADRTSAELFIALGETTRAQRARHRIESVQRRQQQAAHRKHLEAVGPRLEILRNIPFFIPFATRVQIFREFIYRDQIRRRHGFINPDSWRMSISQNTWGRMIDGVPASQDILRRHQANISRDNVFEDAFEQFYDLGEGLKEPIQISFIDKFGTLEAGIDGGGVTKEFLTSVTNEAFKSLNELDLFIENDQNLLYPNPTAVEQRKELLRQTGITEGSPEWNKHVRDLLRRYEFVGRTIGKCLYEGILVDVHFAGFFLLKWALTGGTSFAQKESTYRANLNDLRDLDEGLYQGLLQLKNYPGDVEDFALNFTITDTISVPGSNTRTFTRELKPDGSNIPVTNQNRLVYISCIARHRLQAQPLSQTNAFLQGLGQIIQPLWLSMFNQSELQTLVGGDAGEIDVSDLRHNTLYGGVYALGDDGEEHSTVKLFWEVMEGMTIEERQKVLKFVTSTPRAPLLGFSHLNPRFSIRDSSEDQDRLPSTSTCVNLLKLPRYTTAKVLREKLLYAVNSGAGFDLS